MLIFLSGLLIFIIGLEGSKWSFKNLISERLRKLIISLDDHIYVSILIGVIITAILQSSSAVSIILISLIEAGTLSLKSATGIMIGANIGTTVTVQIISFPVIYYYPYIIILGITIILLSLAIMKKPLFYAGSSIFFFGIIFVGLILITYFFQVPEKRRIIELILKYSSGNIYSGLFLGTIITAMIQSSSALTGIIVSLAYNNLITLRTAIAITLGSNIGTCITAFLASINAGDISKKMAKGHFLFNLLGVIAIIPFFILFEKFVSSSSQELTRQIANAHTFFNIFNVLIIIPFLNTFISWIEGND